MNIINFDDTDVSYHEYFANVLQVWAYRNGRRCGLGPFSAENNIRIGHYIFRLSNNRVFYVMADPRTKSLIVNYVWGDGSHGDDVPNCNIETSQFVEAECRLGEKQLEIWLWSIVHDDPLFYNEEVA